MKNKIAIASAFLAASSFSTAEIVINDFLSFEGFIDMSYTHIDTERGDNNESENNFTIDQVEISWLFDFDPVTAQIDLQHYAEGDYDAVEQAFATYHFDNGGAITAGRYASMIGFEAFEPTGLYQYSFAYDTHPANAGGFNDITIIPGYANGIKYTYETDSTFFGISVQDEAFDNDGARLGGDDGGTWAVEVAGALYMENGLSFFLGGAYENGDDGLGDTYMLNTYVTFETGAWLFAGEINYGDTEDGSFSTPPGFLECDALQALIMANFAYSDAASITGRVSYMEFDSDTSDRDLDFVKFTLAHGYAFTDNLFLVNEISYIDGEQANDLDYESILVAAELIFSF